MSTTNDGGPPPPPHPALKCAYCGAGCELVTGRDVYPHRRDLASIKIWRCVPCEAHVGCHPGTSNPLGRVANAELRRAKMAAHAAFDPLWKSKRMKRRDAYGALAKALGISVHDTHIGMFDVEMCRRVVDAVRRIEGEAPAQPAEVTP